MHSQLQLVLIAALCVPNVSFGEQAAFVAQQRSYGTGQTTTSQSYYPQGHTLADVDGDGDLDAIISATGNFITPKFALLKNNGDGSFESPVFIALSGESADVVAAHLNNDAFIDLAFCVGSYGTGDQWIGVFLGNGDGTFQSELIVPCGIGPTGIAALDADGDGDIDLATANWYWNEADVSVLYNNGVGAFPVRADFPIAGVQPYKIEAGDLNGDTFPDLAVSVRYANPGAAVLLNDQTGGFGTPLLLPQPSGVGINDVPGIALGDLDLDNDLDVLISQGGSVGSWGSIGVFRNNGNGTFAAMQSYATTIGSGHDFAIGDVTGDGWPDVLCTAHSGNYGYSLLPNDGSGSFLAPQSLRAGEWARSISLGDLDSDGELDVVVANSGSNTITVQLNQASGLEMPLMVATGSFTSGIATGDIDHDGDVDVITCDSRIWQVWNDGAGAFTTSFQSMTGGSRSFCQLHDVNGDGWLDVVAKSSSVQVALNEGAVFPGFFQPFADLSGSLGSIQDFTFFDYDNDGDQDLAATIAFTSNQVGIVPNLGNGAWGAAFFLSSPTMTGGTPIVAGDFDNDGDQDLVYGNGNAVAWRNLGGGNFSPPIVSNAAGGFVRMTKGDFNGDGLLDLAGVNYEFNGRGENMVVLRGLGNMSFAAPVTYFGMFSIQYGSTTGISTIDVEQDGDLDLLCADYGGNDVVLFRNHGNGTFAAPIGYGVQGVVTAVHVADIDADGVADVLANIGTAPPLGGAITILRGRPNPLLPVAYCTAKVNSLGCTPQIGWTGFPSATALNAFTITCTQVISQRSGLLFYGTNGPTALPFKGGTMCVALPVRRTPVQQSGGSPTISDCSGVFAFDFNAWARSNVDPLLLAGTTVDTQYWYRDPVSSFFAGLSNAAEFILAP